MFLSVIFFGYTQGLRSGGKLSKACKTDIRYIYLSEGYRPSKTTFNDFRRLYYSIFESLFVQVLHKCLELDMVDMDDPAFGDRTKLRANASVVGSK